MALLLSNYLEENFLTATDYAPFIGLSNAAKYDENGNAASNMGFPFRLHFHPNTTLHNSLPDKYTGVEYETQLSKLIKVGQHLYDVYAQGTPMKEDLSLIGKIIAKSVPTTSKFSDESLFFQHTRFEDDLKTYPSWNQHANEMLEKQQKMPSPGYSYAVMPFK